MDKTKNQRMKHTAKATTKPRKSIKFGIIAPSAESEYYITPTARATKQYASICKNTDRGIPVATKRRRGRMEEKELRKRNIFLKDFDWAKVPNKPFGLFKITFESEGEEFTTEKFT